MYNLLIVDDEIAIVNGLANDIDWREMEIDEVFRACDGRQAVECLGKNRVDVILSDIRMPEMDGLELAAVVKEHWPHAKMIFMSGHDQFEYAKKAMELGVHSYVLKPAADDEIMEAVRKALQAINKEMEQSGALAEAEKQLKEAIPVLQERFLNAWIVQGRTNPLTEPERIGACKLRLNFADPVLMVLIPIDAWEKRMGAENEEVTRLALQNLTREILLKSSEGVFFYDNEDNLVTVIQDQGEKLEKASAYLEGMAELLQKTAYRQLKCTISILLSKPGKTIGELPGMYRSLVEELHRRISWGDGIIANLDKDRPSFESTELSTLHSHPSVQLLVETLDAERVQKKLEDIFHEVGRYKSVSYEMLLELYYSISGALITSSKKRGITLAEWAGNDAEYFVNFGLIRSVQDLKHWSMGSVKKFMDHVLENENKQANKLVEQVKRLILQQLHQNISISDIAATVYLNQSYLSRLFKKETGLSITDYIIRLKMEKARELLSYPGMKVYEVAENLGYESVSHFNRIFKRETGMNPREYQVSV